MFLATRLKLTAWYLAIIMIVSLSFSGLVYNIVSGEISKGLKVRSMDIQNEILRPSPYSYDREIQPREAAILAYNQIRQRIVLQLGFVNGVIFLGAGVAGYFLAGKTLRPIEVMVDDQKRFITDASHELRTPLTALKTEIEVNLRDKNLSLKEAKGLLKSNLEEVDKMQSLSNYLLSLGRYETGAIKLTKSKLQFDKVVEKVIEKNRYLFSSKSVKVKAKLKTVNVIANETSIEELVSILIDNAVKYSNKGGAIKISIEKHRYKALLRVEDHGIGIKSSDIPHIFNRFFRADSSRTKEKVDGYGLGLSIASKIVDLHNGKISVESEIGKGSTFTIVLPLSS